MKAAPVQVDHPLEFLAISQNPPRIVVAVLAPTRVVGTGCLDVPVRPRTNPHICPGRRYGKSCDPSSVSGSETLSPFQWYEKPRPRRRRVRPGALQSDRRRRATGDAIPQPPNIHSGSHLRIVKIALHSDDRAASWTRFLVQAYSACQASSSTPEPAFSIDSFENYARLLEQ